MSWEVVFIRRISKLVVVIPALLWLLLIVVLSRQPYADQSIQSFLHDVAPKEVMTSAVPDVTVHYNGATIVAKKEPYRFVEFLFRKSAHLGVYAVLACVTAFALRKIPGLRGKEWVAWCGGIASTMFVGMLDETLQSEAALRTPAVQDVLVDMTGGTIGVLAAYAGWRWRTREGRLDNRKRE
ncbi:VanZ family protein [Cohnella soli]|uniref:VanZ family protein n=1 Tax=Cohnella soli TaxID=425005 RepID=A0ABW0HKR2_9BACL